MTHYKNQVVEIKQVDYLCFGPGGQNKKDVKMKVSPAMSFGINMTGHIFGVAYRLAAMLMKIRWLDGNRGDARTDVVE
jgi:hypothetical protein